MNQNFLCGYKTFVHQIHQSSNPEFSLFKTMGWTNEIQITTASRLIFHLNQTFFANCIFYGIELSL